MNGTVIVRASGPKNYPGDAKLFLDHRYARVNGIWTLTHHRGVFRAWSGKAWHELENDALEAEISEFFHGATVPSKDDTTSYYVVNRDSLKNLVGAVKNLVLMPQTQNFNHWSDTRDGDPDPSDIAPMQNGLLDTRTRTLLDPTPRFFNTYALTFSYDVTAAVAPTLQDFMISLFGNDTQRHALMQEMIGYLCTPSLEKHKMFDLLGPPRSGKGTVARLVKELVGEPNYGTTSISSLGDTFGLENISDKPVVVLGDAAASGRSPMRAMENLLGIVGEDTMTVNPKGRREYSAKLPCRFMMLTNDLPNIFDRSGALQSRTLVLRFHNSFVGKEDETLGDRLAAELPAIFNWALDGVDRLRARGHFVQPSDGAEDLALVAEDAAPERSFVEDLCELGDEFVEPSPDLFLAWQNWCYQHNVKDVGSNSTFLKRLRGPYSQLESRKMPRENGRQRNGIYGVRLIDDVRERYVMTQDAFRRQAPEGDATTEAAQSW